MALSAFAREIGRGAEDPERIDRACAALADAVVAALEGHGSRVTPANATRGREARSRPRWAHAALLDEAMLDPDGLPDRRQLIEPCIAASRRPPPGAWRHLDEECRAHVSCGCCCLRG